MSELLLSGHTTLHDISGGNPQFIGNVHIQSSDGDFLYALPSQKNLDDGQINFIASKQGYALIQIKSPGPNLVALKAISPKPVSARIWTDSMAPLPSAPVMAHVQSEEKAPKKSNLSMLLWVALLILAIYFLSQKSGGQLKRFISY